MDTFVEALAGGARLHPSLPDMDSGAELCHSVGVRQGDGSGNGTLIGCHIVDVSTATRHHSSAIRYCGSHRERARANDDERSVCPRNAIGGSISAWFGRWYSTAKTAKRTSSAQHPEQW